MWFFHAHFHSEVFSLFGVRQVWAENPGDLLKPKIGDNAIDLQFFG